MLAALRRTDDGGYSMTFEAEYEDVSTKPGILYYPSLPRTTWIERRWIAIESLTAPYGSQAQGKSISSRPTGRSIATGGSQSSKSEWRLGRVTLPDAQDPPVAEVLTPQTPNEIVDCLKRIQSSIRLWTKKGGRQGYLNFVSEFLPWFSPKLRT